MKIVLEVPDNCNPGFFTALQDLAAKMTVLGHRGARQEDFAMVETSLAATVARVEAEAIGCMLSAMDMDAPGIRVDGRVYKNLGRQPKTYRTLAGEVTIERHVYRAVDVRNGPTLDPIAVRVGMVGDAWLPAAAKAVAHGLALTTSREAAQMAEQMCRLPYSRSTFERVGHLVGDLYRARNTEIEEILASRFEVPQEACSVSVSIDRTSVPMEEVAENGEDVVRAFRMGHCATLTFHDDEGEAIHTVRYGRMPGGDIDNLDLSVQGDLSSALAQREDLRVVLLADGAEEMWNRLNEIADGLSHEPTRLVDFWHLCEYLSAAARAIAQPSEAASMLARWKDWLRESRWAWLMIKADLKGHEHEEVVALRRYVDNHAGMLNYAEAKAANLPIGSGGVEATCKSLMGQRLKRSGSRWKRDTGENVVQLRALQLSDRWDDGVKEALKPLRREIRYLAAA